MIAEALSVEVERHASRTMEAHPAFAAARAGRLGPWTVRHYVASITQLLRRTPPCLERACAGANEAGRQPLAAYFAAKLREETGHDQWGESDLETLSARGIAGTDEALPGMHTLISRIEASIDEDPVLYLAYILFAEYLTVLIGPTWVDLLEKRCGIPREAMTAITKHVELDQGHVAELLAEIDELVTDPRDLPRMREALYGFMADFDAFLSEVAAGPVDEHTHAAATV